MSTLESEIAVANAEIEQADGLIAVAEALLAGNPDPEAARLIEIERARIDDLRQRVHALGSGKLN